MGGFLNENHRGSPTLTLRNVLGVLGVLNVLDVLKNMFNGLVDRFSAMIELYLDLFVFISLIS